MDGEEIPPWPAADKISPSLSLTPFSAGEPVSLLLMGRGRTEGRIKWKMQCIQSSANSCISEKNRAQGVHFPPTIFHRCALAFISFSPILSLFLLHLSLSWETLLLPPLLRRFLNNITPFSLSLLSPLSSHSAQDDHIHSAATAAAMGRSRKLWFKEFL